MGKMMNNIRRAVLTLVGKDDKEIPESQTSSYKQAYDTEILFPYGFHANLPLNSTLLLFLLNGQEENRTAMGYRPDLRPKELKEGEVAIGNFMTESIVKFLENGDIEVTGKNDIIVNIDKNLNISVTGDATINVDGDVGMTVGGEMTTTITGNWTVEAADVTFTFDSLTVEGATEFATSIAHDGVDIGKDHVHTDVVVGSADSGAVKP